MSRKSQVGQLNGLQNTVPRRIALSGNAAINEARADIAMHATTMDLWAGPNVLNGTGSAVTMTDIVDAPQAGARRTLIPIVATVITDGAVFDVDGDANYTAAAGDRVEFEAVTVSTFKVHITKADGTAVVVATAKFVQRVEGTPYTTYSSTATNIPYDNTTPQNTEGVEYATVTITPTSATNRLKIYGSAGILGCSAANMLIMALFQDSTAGAIKSAATHISASGTGRQYAIVHEMAAGTTSATTFKLRIGIASGTLYVNGDSAEQKFNGTCAVNIWVEEVAS